jgi:hypothetical protein
MSPQATASSNPASDPASASSNANEVKEKLAELMYDITSAERFFSDPPIDSGQKQRAIAAVDCSLSALPEGVAALAKDYALSKQSRRRAQLE